MENIQPYHKSGSKLFEIIFMGIISIILDSVKWNSSTVIFLVFIFLSLSFFVACFLKAQKKTEKKK